MVFKIKNILILGNDTFSQQSSQGNIFFYHQNNNRTTNLDFSAHYNQPNNVAVCT